jgi:hypothetical protein
MIIAYTDFAIRFLQDDTQNNAEVMLCGVFRKDKVDVLMSVSEKNGNREKQKQATCGVGVSHYLIYLEPPTIVFRISSRIRGCVSHCTLC